MELHPQQSPGQRPQAAQSLEPPRPVVAAVRLMYAGAALSAIQLALALVTVGSLHSAIHHTYPSYPASRVHSIEVSLVVSGVITQLLAIGLWLLMAQASRRGRRWARTVASGLFAVNTLMLVYVVRQPSISGPLVLDALVWLAGLGAIALLWQRDSSAFYAATTRSRYTSA